uniref:Uncharacterized protein n=1 Tax=Arundo donax TaxID=35708 RepID=A0A0A9ECH2_ARUDO
MHCGSMLVSTEQERPVLVGNNAHAV